MAAPSKKNTSTVPRTRGGLWIIIIAAVLLETTAALQYFYARAGIRAEAEARAKSELRRAELEVNVVAAEVEMSVKALALMAGKNLNDTVKLYDILQCMVANTPNMTGAGFTFDPYYYPSQGKWFEPYCCEEIPGDKSRFRSGQIAGPEHDYFQSEWQQKGRQTDSCLWSEAYYDNSGAKAMLVTCTYPVNDAQGKTVAVAGADVSLGRLKYIAEYLQVYPGSYYSITSANGTVLVPLPDQSYDKGYRKYEEYIEATGWKLAIVIPDKVIYAGLRRVGAIVSLMMLFGLGVLVFILYRTGSNLVKLVNLSNQQERMESELEIARNIQMAMLPTRFPPFPDYPDLNAYGVLIPAKEVGGDLFDFHIRDNKLFFCIGDVSGKGVPASLVMAATRSLFRSGSSYLESPAKIMNQMNDSLAGDNNKQNMFVTFFIGVLDLCTGDLQYCNAGHDSPILLPLERVPFGHLKCHANLPLGVIADFAYTEQSARLDAGDTLFLYTDGVSEAEDSSHRLFGTERIQNVIRSLPDNSTCQEMIETMVTNVRTFAGSAQQSDDLTLFAIRFQPSAGKSRQIVADSQPEVFSRHSLVMRNDIQQIPTLAEWVDMLNLPEELNMSINLALEEVVSNVMLYAYPENKSGQVLVEAEKKENRIVFTVSDSGVPFDPTQHEDPDITTPLEERSVGGLGIFLTKQVMDEVRYERTDKKNILTLVKDLSKQQAK